MIGFRARKISVCCLLATTVVLTACGALTQSDEAAIRLWWLEPYTGSAQAAVANAPLPVVLTVTAVPGLDSGHILTLSGDAELKPYAGARWAEHLPELLSSLIGRSLQASGRFEVLQSRSGRGAGGCDLQLELREFFANLGSDGQTAGVSIAIAGHYRCGSDPARVLRSRAYLDVADQQMSAIVASFQQALDQVTVDLLKQIK